MYGSVLRLPRGAVPDDLLGTGVHVQRHDGTVIVCVAWADYGPGGVLEYRELMVVAMTRLTIPLTGTILRIWVDSRESLEGGRQLWRIPKEMASLAFDHRDGFTGSITVGGVEQASYRFVPRWSVPGRWPSNMVTRQGTESGVRRTLSTMRGRLEVGRGLLSIPADGELAFLNRGKTITNLAVRNLRATFGRSSVDTAPTSAVGTA
jgi:hypothetical protein